MTRPTQQASQRGALESFINRIVAQAPPMTDRQRERLATLLPGGANVVG